MTHVSGLLKGIIISEKPCISLVRNTLTLRYKHRREHHTIYTVQHGIRNILECIISDYEYEDFQTVMITKVCQML